MCNQYYLINLRDENYNNNNNISHDVDEINPVPSPIFTPTHEP